MSRDFYFNKWKETLKRLKQLVDTDIEYQVTKAHDKTLSAAVHRLSSMLGQYMFLYNEVIECIHNNLQVQKTEYMDNIVKAIISRILELRHEMQKLEGSNIQFIGHGIIEVHHTTDDIEMTELPKETRRSENIQKVLDDILAKVKEMKAALEKDINADKETEKTAHIIEKLWNMEDNKEVIHEKKVEIPEEILNTRNYLAMILAHEKTRQVTRSIKVSKLKRERWEKELMGCLRPPARYEIRNTSAKLIQKVFRTYFDLKREQIRNCKRDEILGFNICDSRNIGEQRKKAEEMLQNRLKLHNAYEKEWLARRKGLKEKYLTNQKEQLCDEWRDQIRDWLIEWFDSVQFFYDIPKVGSAAIFKAEVPEPYEWLEENKALSIQKQANKKKSRQDQKFEKMDAKRQEKILKKEEQMKLKTEALLLRKMMKNPLMHPGFTYSHSKRTDRLLEVIVRYEKSWHIYDEQETLDVKQKYVDRIDVEQAIMEAKLKVLPEADEHMRMELLKLKQALRVDYKRNGEEMPVNPAKPIKSENIKTPKETNLTERVIKLIENLAMHGFIAEYPKTNLEDFIGDPNFGGEDLRNQNLWGSRRRQATFYSGIRRASASYLYKMEIPGVASNAVFRFPRTGVVVNALKRPAFPFNYELRAIWWERCHEVCHGFNRILLVGPKASGKTTLVQALASINDAVLFVLDPFKIQNRLSVPYLKRLIMNVLACAKALQPSVIHIKHVQKLFYVKTPPEEAEMNLRVVKRWFVKKLFKKIDKNDKITIIGTCTEPWLAKSSEMLKDFPVVHLLPDCTYSLVVQILKEWVVQHKVLPANFNVTNLAYALQGYSFGYLKEALDKFMSADRIVKIAAFGITPMDVYNFILEDKAESKTEYDKYLKWYTTKTSVGQREMQHLEEQRQFKAATEKYAAKAKKQAKSAPSSTTASYTGL